MTPSLTLAEAQRRVDHWISEIGVRYFDEQTNLVQLVEEVGELARLINREFGEQSWKAGEEPDSVRDALADELADVLFVIICLANQTQVDLNAALVANLAKKTTRDQDRHQNNQKLTGGESP
jgi:NTP pyrophosphatase (non-canonical NTP hydrolase)